MDRRTFLAAAGSAGVLASSGCIDQLSDDSGARIEDLEGQLDAKNATIDAQADTIDELEAEADEYELRLADKSEEIDALEADLAAKVDELAARESDLETKRADLDTTRDELDTLETDLEATENDLRAKRTEISRLKTDIAALESDVSTLEGEVSDLEATISDLEPEHDFTDAEIDAAVAVAHDVRDAVVRVRTTTGYAAGYQIDTGVFATVDHAFGAYRFPGYPRVETYTGSEYQVESEQFETDIDLRVLEGSQSGSRTIDAHGYTTISPGDVVVAVGHPMNVGHWVISVGRYDSATGSGSDRRLDMDMPIMFGNSGSPVVTLDGDFVGMNIAAVEGREVYDRPDDPFFSYGAYDPHARAVPGSLISDQLSMWGY